MNRSLLNSGWQAVCIMPDGARLSMSAHVPGSSINDMINSGLLPGDIFYRDNADAVAEYERCDYEYSMTFDATPVKGSEYILKFCRLDTYCDVYLNGGLLGECADEHIAHEFDVTELLKDGGNELVLYFHSPIAMVDGKPLRPGAFTTERMNTRRTQCTYGWDWVARFISCGICGDVELISLDVGDMVVDSAYVYTKSIDEDSAGIGIDIEFSRRLPRRIITVQVKDPDGRVVRRAQKYVAENFVRMSMDIRAPKLWWPAGYGAQPLYTLEILDGGNVVHTEIFGIRTVKIMQLPDIPGTAEYEKCLLIKNAHYDENRDFSGFILKVNGVKILCMGANWVPSEPFCTGHTDEKITRTLEMAAGMGLNMLRIWGGGTFESDHFYNECSRLGIMVTQDFLMACGQYPENEDWFIAALRSEAEYAARRLRNKACLMWWSGDNENAVNGCDTDENYQGRRSAYDGIAPALYALDPYREFLPSSPYGGKKYASNTIGTTHNTQYLGDDILPYMMSGDCADYREAWKRFRARFIAEEPQLGAVSELTARKFMTEDDMYGESDRMWLYHTKSNPALRDELFDISARFAESVLGSFADKKDRYFKLRYLQYEWVRLTMEQLRREMWFQSGLIYWMLNDCWPAASGWALIDYYNRPKDAYYAFRRCAKPAVISMDRENGIFRLHVSNTGAAIDGAKFRIAAVSGSSVRVLESIETDVPGGMAGVVCAGRYALNDGEIIVADMEYAGGCDRTFWKEGALEIVPADAVLSIDREKHTVTVKAEKYVHAVELSGDCIFEDNCFSLMPGEERTLTYCVISDSDIGIQAYTLR